MLYFQFSIKISKISNCDVITVYKYHIDPYCSINPRCCEAEDPGSGPGRDADPLSPWWRLAAHSETWHAARLYPQSNGRVSHKYTRLGLNPVFSDWPACVCVYSSAQVVIDKHPVRFFVHKRPHVDFFLEVVSVRQLYCKLSGRNPQTCSARVSFCSSWSYKLIFVLHACPWWLQLVRWCMPWTMCVHRWASGMSWWFSQPAWRSTAQQLQTSWTTIGTSWNADTTDRYCSDLCVCVCVC